MADVSRTVEIIFGAEDRISSVINNMSKSFGTIGGTIGDIAAPLAGVTNSVLKLDAALVSMAAVGLAYAYKSSVEFENSIIDLNKVLSSGESIDVAIKKAKELAMNYGESSGIILESMGGFKQAGFDLNESMLLAEKALQLVVVGDIDASKATEMLIASLKGFGTEANSSTRIIEILNAVSNTFATDVDQLGTGMSKLSPIAKQMGFTLEETAGLVTPIIEVFRSGDEAANALKTGLLKLTGESSKIESALAKIGVSQKLANDEIRSGKDIFLDVGKAFQGMSDSQKSFATQQLVGIDQAGKMSVVFSNLAKYQDIVTVATNDTKSAYVELQGRLESSEMIIKRLGVGFKDLSSDIGDKFKAAANEGLVGAQDMLAAITKAVGSGAFDPIFDMINQLGLKIGETFKAIATNLPSALGGMDLSGLMDAFGDLGVTIGNFFGDIDLTSAEGLKKAIQGIVDTGELLVNVTNGIVTAFKPYFDAFREAVSRGNEMEASTQKVVGEILGAASAITEFGIKIAVTMAAIGKSGADIKDVFDIVIGSMKAMWNGLQAVFDEAVIIISGLIRGLAASVQVLLGPLAMIGPLADKFKDLDQSLQILQDGMEADQVKNFGEMMDGVAQASGAASSALDDVSKSTDSAKKSAKDLQPEIATTVSGLELLTGEHVIDVDINKKKVADVNKEIKSIATEWVLVNGVWKEYPLEPEVSKPAVVKVKKSIDEIKVHADVIKSAFEWKAKMNIAEVNANASKVKALAESIGEIFRSTGDVISGLFGGFGGVDVGSSLDALMRDQLRKENKIRQEQHEMQMELSRAELEYTEIRNEKLKNEDSLIEIKADGLEPELEAFMWKILKKIQIRASEEASEFLKGI